MELPDLNSTVPNLHLYYGHTPAKSSSANEPEPLADHIDLVNQTALQLIKLHNSETVIENLIKEICEQLSLEPKIEGNFLKELFLASIVFHDFGKLNENFQAERLQNEDFSKVNLSIGSQHSILSAYLFINYFLEKLVTLKIKSADTLVGIICAFSDPILKHHSAIFDVGDIDTEKCNQLNRFLPLVGIQSKSKFLDYVLNNKRQAEEAIYQESNKKPESYPLFILLKLNFSLLTAADYLATLSYQYNTTLPDVDHKNWWGVFSSEHKAKLCEKFKKSEGYNNLAIIDPEKLMAKPLHLLKKRSPENLNSLRSRMLGEVILNLKQNKDANLFYLKAPTGAGKTNISLAIAIDLLQQYELNKIFYVFPFTTLITQTYASIIKTLDLKSNEIVQLHSKAEWNIKKDELNQDGHYSEKWVNHIDNLFIHYPIVLLSHIRFFDILKGNQKENNYILHRLANSVVIIDEIQSYSPKFWDHINYFITNYAKTFNIKFVVMSATLPEIGRLTSNKQKEWIELIPIPDDYFRNDNFAKRVSFDFSLLEEGLDGENQISVLSNFIADKTEKYANQNESSVKVIVEFITKKSASDFVDLLKKHPILRHYELLMMTGTILEPRREEVKNWLKCSEWLKYHPKVLLVSTQVVEAGVDIDMDIGFKDSSLIDSDEQLAGRVNRNASKNGNIVYLFNLDSEGIVYKNDERLKIQREELSLTDHKNILENKDFNFLYNRIIEKHLKNRNELIRFFDNYLEHLRSLRFTAAHREFQLIEDNTVSLFIPLYIPITAFSNEEQSLLSESEVLPNSKNKISGSKIFDLYEQVIINQSDNFIENRDGIRRIQSLLSKFSISVFPKTAEQIEMMERLDYNQEDPYRYGYLYCSGYKGYYNYETGLSLSKEKRAVDFI